VIDPTVLEKLAHGWVITILNHFQHLKIAPSGSLSWAEELAVATE
jgi:hypothetical protein